MLPFSDTAHDGLRLVLEPAGEIAMRVEILLQVGMCSAEGGILDLVGIGLKRAAYRRVLEQKRLEIAELSLMHAAVCCNHATGGKNRAGRSFSLNDASCTERGDECEKHHPWQC